MEKAEKRKLENSGMKLLLADCLTISIMANDVKKADGCCRELIGQRRLDLVKMAMDEVTEHNDAWNRTREWYRLGLMTGV